MNITITIPKDQYRIWMAENNGAIKQDMELNFRIPNFPKDLKKGDKVYTICNGRILGYHIFKGFDYLSDGFVCELTNKYWNPGKYLIRDARTWVGFQNEVYAKSHQGFRYVEEIKDEFKPMDREQEERN